MCPNLRMECFKFAAIKFTSIWHGRLHNVQNSLQFCNEFAREVNSLHIYCKKMNLQNFTDMFAEFNC